MDEHLKIFCKYCINLLADQHHIDIESTIAIIIHYIKQNNIIYVNNYNYWYEYNHNSGLWNRMDNDAVSNLYKKLLHFYNLFDKQIPAYIAENSNEFDQAQTNRILISCNRIAEDLLNENYCENKLIKKLRSAFEISKYI
jgi:hypothetical protein